VQGVFIATLQVTDTQGNKVNATVEIITNNARPRVTIVSPRPNLPGNVHVYTRQQPILFSGSAIDVDTPLKYSWEYEFYHNYHYHTNIKIIDNHTFYEANPPDEGSLERNNLRVILRVIDAKGLEGESSIMISRPDWETAFERNNPPVADFAVSGQMRVGQPIGFDASPTEDPDQDFIFYKWDFGDGFTLDGFRRDYNFKLTTHVFDYYSPAGYTVNLTCTDNWGASTTKSRILMLTPDPSYTNETFTGPPIFETTVPETQRTDVDSCSSKATDATTVVFDGTKGNSVPSDNTSNGVQIAAVTLLLLWLTYFVL
jgi:hypothetical protein